MVYIYVCVYVCVCMELCMRIVHCQGLKVLVDSYSDIHLGLIPFAL